MADNELTVADGPSGYLHEAPMVVELAGEYGFQIDPAPPAQPKKKGKVESVQAAK